MAKGWVLEHFMKLNYQQILNSVSHCGYHRSYWSDKHALLSHILINMYVYVHESVGEEKKTTKKPGNKTIIDFSNSKR